MQDNFQVKVQDNSEIKIQKDYFNLKTVKYRRIANAGGSLITFSQEKQKMNRTNIVQFPMIDKLNQKQKVNPTVLILQKKIIQQEIEKKSRERQSKSLMKQINDTKKRKIDESMNMLGLDVIRIKCLNDPFEKQYKRQQNYRKMSVISQKMSDIKLQKQLSKELNSVQRKRRQSNQVFENISKLQLTDSFLLTNKRKSFNNTTAHFPKRKNSQTSSQKQIDGFLTLSPKKTNNPRNKKQYLYKKLEGTQHKKKQQFGQVYERRIKSYLDLLFKVQLSYNFYTNLDLKIEDVSNRPKRWKAYVGPGNNGAMIKGLLKRRFWWTIVEQRTEDCHFVWTQIKINQIFNRQIKKVPQKMVYKIQQFDQESRQTFPKKSPSRKKKSLMDNRQEKFFQNNQNFNYKIFHPKDQIIYFNAYARISERERQLNYQQKTHYIDKQLSSQINKIPYLIHNHLQNNFYLGNKKALFHNLKQYYHLRKQNPFDYIPLTFHIKNGIKDPQYLRFCQYHKKRSKLIKKQEKQQEEGYQNKKKTRNIWIVKPGQNSNQGRGITVIDQIYELNMIMKQSSKNFNKFKQLKQKQQKPQTSSTSHTCSNHQQNNDNQNNLKKTFIVQMYIDRPFLYNNRKFDIRHYMLITNFFGITRAYWYQEGYIRTSSYQFNINCFEPQIHLTNDAVQKNFPEYHKYQSYNKLSYEQFQRYLDLNYSQKKYDFKNQILPKMKKMGTDAAKSVFTKICPQNPMNNFEIFGLDFMIDKNFRPWLIQINTNPCLDCECPLLDRIIPYMVEQSFKLSLDIAYPPPHHYPSTYRHFAPLINLETFKYELIFDSQVDGEELKNLYKRVKGNLSNDYIQFKLTRQVRSNKMKHLKMRENKQNLRTLLEVYTTSKNDTNIKSLNVTQTAELVYNQDKCLKLHIDDIKVCNQALRMVSISIRSRI